MLRVLALALAALAASAAACTVLNDFDDLRGGGGGHVGGSGTGADGPITAGAPPCATGLVRDDCEDGQKCTLTAPEVGTSEGFQCGPSGPTEAWHACEMDADCADGSWCEGYTSTCKPWCDTEAQCPAKASCIEARRPDRTPIVGLKVCTAHCNLEPPLLPCGPGVNCVIDDLDEPEADCFKAGTVQAGCEPDPLTDQSCDRGLRLDSDGYCKEWCLIDQETGLGIDASCGGDATDCSDTTTVVYDGIPFALCTDSEC